MISIVLQGFAGEQPKVKSGHLADNFAQSVLNARLDDEYLGRTFKRLCCGVTVNNHH